MTESLLLGLNCYCLKNRRLLTYLIRDVLMFIFITITFSQSGKELVHTVPPNAIKLLQLASMCSYSMLTFSVTHVKVLGMLYDILQRFTVYHCYPLVAILLLPHGNPSFVSFVSPSFVISWYPIFHYSLVPLPAL